MLESVVLLRHAHAGQKSAWTGDDTHRPLSPAGLEQSARLVTALQPYRFDRIWTSPFTRCHHSVASIAAHRHAPLISTPWLAPGSDPTSIDHGLNALEGHVLLCTHGECVQPILHTLARGRETTAVIDKGPPWP